MKDILFVNRIELSIRQLFKFYTIVLTSKVNSLTLVNENEPLLELASVIFN